MKKTNKMETLDLILTIILGVLVATCLVLEFLPVTLFSKIFVAVTGVYALGCLIFFEVRRYMSSKIKDKSNK